MAGGTSAPSTPYLLQSHRPSQRGTLISHPRNPGRIAGLWYLLLVLLGPLRLIVIPSKLFVRDNAPATIANILAHERLFRLGMASDLAVTLVVVLLTLALFRLFEPVDRHLAALVVILGGVMPGTLYLVNVVNDSAVLLVAKGPAFLAAFTPPQQQALAMLLLRLHDLQNTAAETLWGAWLIPLAILTWRSRFLPRFLGIWLALNGLAYLILSLTGVLAPQYNSRLFTLFQPALFAEMAFMLWLVIKGTSPKKSAPPMVNHSVNKT